MHEAIRFLFIRYRQLLHELKNLGFVYLSLLLLIGGVVIYKFIFASITIRQLWLITAVIGLLPLLIHFKRSDSIFLRINARNNFLIYFSEYVLLMLPFILLVVFKTSSLIPFLLVPFAALVSMLTVAGKRRNVAKQTSLTIISSENYEWVAGIRKTGFILVLIYITGFLALNFFFVPMIALWFCLMAISGFYELHESREMVESFSRGSARFINHKIKKHIILFLIPALVLLAVAAMIHPNKWWIYLLFAIYGSLMIGLFVVSKYAVWGLPGRHPSVNLINGICLIGFFIPFLLPVPVIIFILNYRKSIHRLNYLLNDYY